MKPTNTFNPDCMTLEQLEDFFRRNQYYSQAAEEMYPGVKVGFQTAHKLVRYMKLCMYARRARMGGHINDAWNAEDKMNRIFNSLPDYAKW